MAASKIHEHLATLRVGGWGGEGGTTAMASRLDPDGPRQTGLDGATLSANKSSVELFKGSRANKGK